MKASKLIELFQKMYAERWSYEWGASRYGCVDCSGAFVYAFKQFGQSIYHGSNTIARKYVSSKIVPASQAKPGWAIFKQRFDGEEPAEYRSDGLGNFYHIGLLDNDGVTVLNAKGVDSGFSKDPLSKWQFAAPLKGVEYEEGSPMVCLFYAKVITKETSLNLRESPTTSGKIVTKIPKDALVKVNMVGCGDGTWWHIVFNEYTGYASSAYLEQCDLDDENPQVSIEPSESDIWKVVDSEGNEFYPKGDFHVIRVDSRD